MSVADHEIDHHHQCPRCGDWCFQGLCRECRANAVDVYVDERCEELRSKIGG